MVSGKKDENDYCMRCGNCCRDMQWKKKYSFDDAFSLVSMPASKADVEEALTRKYREYIESKGLPVEKMHPPEWDRKNRKIQVKAKAGRCIHLDFTEDNKAICLNYHNRPNECRNYLCKKVKQKIMTEKELEKERAKSPAVEAQG
ncbi:MAG: hypothetical protein R6U32_03530 [Candidatus Woesearchaeota archaeon]